MKLQQNEFLKAALEGSCCALCGLNGTLRKRVFYLFNGQLRLLVCSACCARIGTGSAICKSSNGFTHNSTMGGSNDLMGAVSYEKMPALRPAV